MPYPEKMTDSTNTEQAQGQGIESPDLNHLEEWVESLRKGGIVKPSVSFTHQPEDEQWNNMKKQLEFIIEDGRSIGTPDDQIIKTVLDFVNPEAVISKRT